MMELVRYSEKFSPVGNMTSEGVQRQLGRYELDPLVVLLRETAQNSWDSHLPGRVPEYSLRGWRMTDEQRALLGERVLADRPAGLPLDNLFISPDGPVVLAISDRGTSGLTGPVRADAVTHESIDRDFIDFLLNIGQIRNTEYGGGTYGYGKSILYRLSGCHTILVHTHTTDQHGQPSRRFIAAALGDHHDHYTGRHWWGRLDAEGYPVPVEGDEADSLAAALGMPGFAQGESGTTVAILAPDFGTRDEDQESGTVVRRTPREGMAFLSAAAFWHLWPKVLDACPHEDRMKIAIRWEGEDFGFPRPERHALLSPFARAMGDAEKARTDDAYRPDEIGCRVLDIRSERPQKDLGLLALRRDLVMAPRTVPVDPQAPGDLVEAAIQRLAPATDGLHHVALMRDPRLLVRYEAGPVAESGQYAGVFLVHREEAVDRAFAEAEPPTHDNWKSKGLPRPQSTYVNVALRRVGQGMTEFVQPVPSSGKGDGQENLGWFSSMLAGLVPAAEGTDASVQDGDESREPRRGGGGGGSGSSRPSLRILDEAPVLEERNGQRIARLRFRIGRAAGNDFLEVTARASPLIMDGEAVETEPPERAEQPEVLSWEAEDGTVIRGSNSALLPAEEETSWAVLVLVPDEVAVSIGLTVQGGEA